MNEPSQIDFRLTFASTFRESRANNHKNKFNKINEWKIAICNKKLTFAIESSIKTLKQYEY